MQPYGTITELAQVLAQIVHFAWDDYYDPLDAGAKLPEQTQRTVAYVCACMLAQHTVRGEEGVETEFPYDFLGIAERMPFIERLTLATQAIALCGGIKESVHA